MTLVAVQTDLTFAALPEQVLRVRTVAFATAYDVSGLQQVLRAYLLTASRRGAVTSPRTVRTYLQSAAVWIRWAQDNAVSILRVDSREASRFVAALQLDVDGQVALRPNSVALRVAGVRALYRALAWAGAADSSAFAAVFVPTEPTPGVVLNPPYGAELEAVLLILPPTERALLLLCAHAGLRISEALALRRSDVTSSPTGLRAMVYGKGGKKRVVPLGRRMREALQALPPSPDRFFDWNYDQATYRLKKGFREAGHSGAWRGFHAARKSAASRLYGLSRDFTRVSLFLGHASVDTTRRYVAVPEDDLAELLEDS